MNNSVPQQHMPVAPVNSQPVKAEDPFGFGDVSANQENPVAQQP
jgi:hypothetical protein